MKTSQDSSLIRRELSALLLMFALLVPSALGQGGGAAVAPKPAVGFTGAETAAAARVNVETIREVTTKLSSREMEGRGTALPGGERAAKYLADRFAALGLKPLGDAGTFLQAVPFKSATPLPESFFKTGEVALTHGTEFVASPPYTAEQSDASGGLVFAGYGVVSPEIKRDDLAGLDLKGKIVIIISGRPNNVDEATWKKAIGPQSVGRNILGRGAAALVIAGVGSKEQPFAVVGNYLSRRRVSLASDPEMPFKLPPIVLASNEGLEKLFAGTETTYAQALAKAASGEFVSRELNKQASISIRIKKDAGTGSNVVGLLEGSDPKLKDEAVVYTAHYDAYGIDASGRIFPGAADNALGVGQLMAIAEAMAKTPARPRRSVIFLAVTGEEYGLLGAEYWAAHPTWPLEKVAADLNFDGIGTEVYGPVKRVVGFGMEHSDLGAVLEAVVTAQGGQITPDPMPEEKAFYRSDHYAFVKKGVPALMLLGIPAGEVAPLLARAKKWMATDYHQPTDIIRPDWNWDGPRTIAVIGLITGMRVANAEAMPAWLQSSPLNRPRGGQRPAAAPSAANP
ncbi:MAG TPA: M28 family peptidase [Pyrinomonadaceae bacterium]|jgi:hypothetical protein